MSPEIDYDELGARIRTTRMRKGIRQHELIAKIDNDGINQSLLSSLECCTPKKRTRETVEKIERICDHLGIRVPYKSNGANGKGMPFIKEAAATPPSDKPEPNLNPVAAAPVPPTLKLKPELAAMATCIDALDKMPDTPTKFRVIRWLESCVHEETGQ